MWPPLALLQAASGSTLPSCYVAPVSLIGSSTERYSLAICRHCRYHPRRQQLIEMDLGKAEIIFFDVLCFRCAVIFIYLYLVMEYSDMRCVAVALSSWVNWSLAFASKHWFHIGRLVFWFRFAEISSSTLALYVSYSSTLALVLCHICCTIHIHIWYSLRCCRI